MSNADLGTGTYRIIGDASGAVGAANQANAALATLEQAVNRNWWGIQNLAKAFAVLPSAVAAGVAASIKAATDWQEAMAGVERTTYDASLSVDENKKQLGALEGQLKDIAKTKPVPTVEIAGIAESAGALGVAKNDIAAFTATVADLSATTDLTSEAAATDLARIAALTGVAGDGYKKLASAILETGISTAATEPEITKMATGMLGAANTFRLTAADVIGLSAAFASVGVKSELARTNFQLTLIGMDRAISQNGKQLRLWAKLAGQSTEEFAQSFRNDATDAFVAAAEGLAKVQKSGKSLTPVYDELGIKGTRQIQLLNQIAAGQNSAANSNVRLTNVLKTSRNAFDDGNAVTDTANRRYQTFAKQSQILRNNIFLLANQMGQSLLPILTTLNHFLVSVVNQFAALPGPVRAGLAIFVGLAAVLSGVIFIFITLFARILQILPVLRRLRTAAAEAGAGLAGTGAGGEAAAVGVGSATVATEGFETALSGLKISLGVVGLALAGLAAAYALYQRLSGKSSDSAVYQANAVDRLVEAYKKGTTAAGNLISSWVDQQIAEKHLSSTAKELGISHAALHKIIAGTASDKQYEDFVRRVSKASKEGKTGATDFGISVQDLAKKMADSKDAAIQAGASYDFVASSGKKATKETKAAAAALELDAETAKTQVQAYRDSVDAKFALAQANFDVQDSEKALADARKGATQNVRNIEKAEIELAKARITAANSDLAVHDAEQSLATARLEQSQAISKAEDSLADARDARANAVEAVAQKEQALQDLKTADYTDKITKAELAYKESLKDVRDTTQAVKDAQWQLNHLREEGAGKRDIIKGENDLSDARLAAAEATSKSKDAAKELADLKDPAVRAKAIAAAERELASAKRDVVSADQAIASAELNLQQVRSNTALNENVRKAESSLKQARLDSKSNALAVTDAEDGLAEARKKSTSEEIRKAELAYTMSLYHQAQAVAEVRKQHDLMQGSEVDVGKETGLLIVSLQQIADALPENSPTKKNLQKLIDSLKKAPKIPEVIDSINSIGDSAEANATRANNAFKDVDPLKDLDTHLKSSRGFWDRLASELFNPGKFKGISDGFKSVGKSVMSGFWSGVQWIWHRSNGQWFVDRFTDAVHSIKKFFGIHSPSTLMAEIGRDVMRGFGNGVLEIFHDVLDWFKHTPGRIRAALGKATEWLTGIGGDVMSGMWRGMKFVWTAVTGWFGKRADAIIYWIKKGAGGSVQNAGKFFEIGGHIIQGVWNGIKGKWKGLVSWLWEKVKDLPSILQKFFKLASPSKLMHYYGEMIGQGLHNGLKASMGRTEKMFNEAVNSISPDKLMNNFKQFGIDGYDINAAVNHNMNSSTPIFPTAGSTSPSMPAPIIKQGDHIEGDTFELTAITDATAEQIVGEWRWSQKPSVRTGRKTRR